MKSTSATAGYQTISLGNFIRTWLLVTTVVLQAVAGGAQPVTQVAGGGNHTLFLKSNGSLWATGCTCDGQLGDGVGQRYGPSVPGASCPHNIPEMIVSSNVTAIAAGESHSVFLKSDGSLWAMGYNYDGELGDGSYYNTNRPEMIVPSNVTAITAGSGFYDTQRVWSHSLFLKSDGSLWGMGYNAFGELADGNYSYNNQPILIVASNVTAIAAGGFHSLFIKSDGSLWAMGDNKYIHFGTNAPGGQLGDGTYNNTNQPEMIVASNVIAVAAGRFHSLFIKSDGSLWAMGYNGYGELGDGTYNNTNLPEMIVPSNVVAVATRNLTSLFLKSDGSLWGMGYNAYGELGDGTFSNTNLPEMIVAGNVVAISAGDDHNLFIKNDGSLWGMGYDGDGELGQRAYKYQGYNQPQLIVSNQFYNHIACQLLPTGDVQLSFVGIAGANYALDWSPSLPSPDWQPLATNPAGTGGALVFTNTPDPATNNFWRIRSVP